jgi:hypothetical protein
LFGSEKFGKNFVHGKALHRKKVKPKLHMREFEIFLFNLTFWAFQGMKEARRNKEERCGWKREGGKNREFSR